ncbi:hypothetical protein OBBRIDRAFT_640497 [Obba rivulosa]|uniref:Uncharacterized protein n=1 Tax=Obba rivulosa TaxID=1052685 RepID=A0A8E2DKA0_9APHY|nr:hypothetical protein OBBRIDRAFT_640497 [Obba rivulosa]
MPILPPLNDDCTLIVISHLNKRAILSLAHASSVALAALRPYVLRTVSLRRNAEQVNEFCQCVLSQDLAGYIRDLDISPSALYPAGSDPTPGSDDEPKPVIFARALADVLEKSVNLKALKLAGLEILLECEPRIGAALIAHPPHAKLELSGIGERGFVALGSMRSPPNISLQPSPPFNSTMARNIQAGDCITAFLTRNAELFQDVVFGGLISRWLDTFLKSHSLTFPNVHKLVMHPLDMSLRQCAMAFPAVRYLSADWPEPAIADGQVLWPDLLSIEGPSPLVFYAALNYPNIRRIHLWDKYHMEPEDEFAGLCTIMQQRAIAHIA